MVGRVGIPVFFPISVEKAFSFSPFQDIAGCGFIIYGLHYVEVLPLYAHFVESLYQEWMLNSYMVKSARAVITETFGFDHAL